MLESYDSEKERKLQKHVSVETIALKKMRELKGLTRKEAGVLFGVSHKQIEKTENGLVHLSQARINRFIEGYGYTHSDYENICQGRVHLISNKKIQQSPKR